MTDPNMPNDKRGAEIHLLAKKLQLIELAALIVNGEIETFSQVNGFIWSEVERLEEAIEGDH